MREHIQRNIAQNQKKNIKKPSKIRQIMYFPDFLKDFIRALIVHPLAYLQCLEFSGTIQINWLKLLQLQ